MGVEMRNFMLKTAVWIAGSAIVIGATSYPAAAQSAWTKMKMQFLQQACKGGDQNSCQQLAKLNQKLSQQGQPQHPEQQPQAQPQQSGQQQQGQQPSDSGQQQRANQGQDGSGPIKPPPGTKVEEKVMAPLVDGAKFFVSPHGVHIATFESSGSRAVIYYDGVPGPKFDEILGGESNMPAMAQIGFSPDGKRYAYCGHLGNEFVVMVDGKELMRSSESDEGRFNGSSCQLGFTSNSRHVYYISKVVKDNMTGHSYFRFVFDGQSGPLSYSPTTGQMHPVFSPDGNHYAYVATDPADSNKWGLVIDGKMAPYRGGEPQWSADSQHLYTILVTTVPGRGQVAEAMVDGKPFMRADSIRLHVAPVGNMWVAEVNAASTTPQPLKFMVVDGKKVPGTEIVSLRGANFDQVTISPDGKHYATRFTNADNRQYVFVDGKRGQDYQVVDQITFTADSSKVTYTALTNAKRYVVIGDQESDACGGAVVVSPVGGHAGTICGPTGGRATMYMDGKTSPLPNGALGGSDLRFSPDGQHFAYRAPLQGGAQRLVVDGVVQMNSNLGTPSNPSGPYVFSPDSRHIAVDSLQPNPTGQYAFGVFLDGKYVPSLINSAMVNLGFTADSKHLAWAQGLPGRHGFRIYVDGKPVAEGDSAMAPGSPEAWWDMAPDGSLSVLVQDENNLKRITITPSPETSLATLGGDGTVLAKRVN